MKNAWWIVPVAAVGLWVASAIDTFKRKYTVAIERVKWVGYNGLELKFDVNLAITNPTELAANVSKIALAVLFNNVVIATATGNANVTVQANGKTTIPVRVNVPVTGVLKSVKPAIDKLLTGEQVGVVVKGSVNIGSFTVNVNEPATLGF